MSASTIEPSDCPLDLRMKIEHVMADRKLTWREAVFFLLLKVFTPAT